MCIQSLQSYVVVQETLDSDDEEEEELSNIKVQLILSAGYAGHYN